MSPRIRNQPPFMEKHPFLFRMEEHDGDPVPDFCLNVKHITCTPGKGLFLIPCIKWVSRAFRWSNCFNSHYLCTHLQCCPHLHANLLNSSAGILIFLVYTSMNFNTSRDLRNYHHSQDTEQNQNHKELPRVIAL